MTTLSETCESFPGRRFARVRAQIEFGDIVVVFYALVFVRQYLWILDRNLLAWALGLPLAVGCWHFYLSTKQFRAEKFGLSFWLVVGLPLLATYLLRAALPDRSYDVLTYHLLHAERTLRGTLFAPGDFFPSAVPFNPVADTLTGISRLLLGFRLGTVINLLALVWAAQVTDKILRPSVSRRWLRAAGVLLVVLSEQMLFEISTYMVDLLALPLMLEAILLTLRADEARNRRANVVHVALLLGAATAFKITNLAVALPVLAVCAYQVVVGPRRFAPRQLTMTAVLALAAFVAPQLPFTIYIWRLTGNPIFPIANVFFESPYWPMHGWDYRWGPQNVWETIAWPVLSWFKPGRLSELAVYSGRLSLGFVVAITGLPIVWRNRRGRTICFILVSSALLWSATNVGYSRYGLCQEMLAGITVIVVACALTTNILGTKIPWRTALAATLGLVLLVQAYFACSYVLQKSWSSNKTVFDVPGPYTQEAKLMLRDHSLTSFLSDEQRALFDNVQVWFETAPKSTGFEVLLNSRAPIIAARQPEYFFTGAAWRQFIRAVEQSPEQRMFSLCLNDDLATAKQSILKRGLEVGTLTPVDLPFFSPRDRIGMMLIEVRIPDEPEARRQFEAAWMKGTYAPSVYREQIVAIDPPPALRPGEKADIRFKVKNLGTAAWPAVGTKDFRYQVNMGNHWIGAGTSAEDSRAAMKADLAPGSETEMTMTVNAPRSPGEYTLEIDMVHEGVTWFKERGARPLQLHVRVQP